MFEVKEKPKRVERAYLVSVVRRKEDEDLAESLLDELAELTGNLGIGVMGRITACGGKLRESSIQVFGNVCPRKSNASSPNSFTQKRSNIG